MNKNKIMTICVLVVPLLCAMIFGVMLTSEKTTAPALFLEVRSNEGDVETVRVWQDESGNAFFFLPSYAEMENVRFRLGTDSVITLDGVALEEGFSCGAYETEREYTLTYENYGRKTECILTFISSSGISTAYIDTASGSMDHIHSKKDNREKGSLRVYSTTGRCEYSTSLDSVSGRGNYTWRNFEKKPYNIELSSEAGLLGMDSGRKWILLANASDGTSIRNELVFTYSEMLGLSYTPDREWVELYLNGEYAGLYQMCEKIEIGDGRVDVPTDSVLVSSESAENADTTKNNYFTTDAGTLYRVRSSNTDARIAEAQRILGAFEMAVTSDNGIDSLTGENWQNMIDIDSFARKYLIEEVFANHDAGYTSGYYCITKKDGRDLIYAGPVWDYDLSAGNTASWQLQFPQSFFADREYIKDDTRIVVFSSLCDKSEFYEYVTELYEREFSPALREKLTNTIDSLRERTENALMRDAVRYGSNTEKIENEYAHLREYMSERLDFLDSVFCDGAEYCTVRATQGAGGYYAYIAVKKGECLDSLPVLPDNPNARFAGWFCEGTNDPFDVPATITEDAAIYAKWDKNDQNKLDDIAKLAPVAVFAIAFCGFGITAVVRMRRGE